MKKVIFAFFTLLMLSGCTTTTGDEPVPVEIIITPSATEYTFGSEGGIFIVTVENRPGVLGRNLPPTGFGLCPDIYGNNEAETVTITVESNTPDIPSWWELRIGASTNKYGLPPDVYDEVKVEMGGNRLGNDLISLFQTNWFEIERIETDVLVIRVEPNESENERHLFFGLGFAPLVYASVLIKQSAKE